MFLAVVGITNNRLVEPCVNIWFLDIDECSANIDDCANATSGTCTNTLGSFLCSCNTGYTGDGKTCVGRYSTRLCHWGKYLRESFWINLYIRNNVQFYEGSLFVVTVASLNPFNWLLYQTSTSVWMIHVTWMVFAATQMVVSTAFAGQDFLEMASSVMVS